MRRTRLSSFAVACLLAGLWSGVSCILNPQPEPPGNTSLGTGATGSSTTGGAGPAAGSTGAGGSIGTGGGPGAGGSGGSGIVLDASSPPIDGTPADGASGADAPSVGDAAADAGSDEGAGGFDGGEAGPTEGGADATPGEGGDGAVSAD